MDTLDESKDVVYDRFRKEVLSNNRFEFLDYVEKLCREARSGKFAERIRTEEAAIRSDTKTNIKVSSVVMDKK